MLSDEPLSQLLDEVRSLNGKLDRLIEIEEQRESSHKAMECDIHNLRNNVGCFYTAWIVSLIASAFWLIFSGGSMVFR